MPLDLLNENDVRKITIMASAQMGKSFLLTCAAAYSIAVLSSPTLLVAQTADAIRQMMRSKVLPVLKNCVALNNQWPSDKHQSNLGGVEFSNASLLAVPQNQNALRAHSVRIALLDECSNWIQGSMQQAEARTLRWWDSRVIACSTPLFADDDFHATWKAGNQCNWGLSCPMCAEVFAPEFEDHIKWNHELVKENDDNYDWDNLRDSVVMVCPKCEGEIKQSDEIMRGMNSNGHYVEANPNAPKELKSFRFNCLSLPCNIYSWADCAEEFLRCRIAEKRGNIQPLTEWKTLRCALPFCASDSYSGTPITIGDYKADELWEREHVRFMTIDVRAN
jgi:phage terminase large subunit GpA-like protein